MHKYMHLHLFKILLISKFFLPQNHLRYYAYTKEKKNANACLLWEASKPFLQTLYKIGIRIRSYYNMDNIRLVGWFHIPSSSFLSDMNFRKTFSSTNFFVV